MRLKVDTDYAIRMVHYLARNEGITGAAEISEATNVPLRFAKTILQKLTMKGIVASYKGVKGGYELGKRLEDINLYDIVLETDGPVKINRCLLKDGKCLCSSPEGCPYNKVFKEVSVEMENKLKTITIDNII